MVSLSEVSKIKESAVLAIKEAKSEGELREAEVRYLGRKGILTSVLRSLKDLPIADRKKIGPKANAFKNELAEIIEKKKKQLITNYSRSQDRVPIHSALRAVNESRIRDRIGRSSTKSGQLPIAGRLDITKPGKKVSRGHLHPLTIVDEEVRKIFTSLNFSVVEGPEIETEYYNFDALNIPANHPARDMWDTFWLQSSQQFLISKSQFLNKSKIQNPKSQRLLLRTHTSPVQIRYMERHEPPFQIIVPGRVFRYEATDASHEINFYQVEGLMVGKDVTLANFKFVIEEFFKKFFNEKITFRYRPSYFPFVEPGLEVEIKISQRSNVKGQMSGWLEVMGAGMVHRNVFDAVRYNPDKVQGFAFGMGLDRLAMIKYNIPDIRLFYSGDLRFIKQF